jgi:hypothetical protein
MNTPRVVNIGILLFLPVNILVFLLLPPLLLLDPNIT